MYNFRVAIELHCGTFLNCSEDKLVLNVLQDHAVIIKAISAKKINKSNNLILVGSGFKDEKDAYIAGQKAYHALLICGTEQKIGIKLESKKREGGMSQQYLKEIKDKFGIDLKNYIPGLSVYKEGDVFVTCSATGTCYKSIEGFINSFSKAFSNSPNLSEKESLAFELYNLSYFESSRAKFLTLVICIEVLCEETERSPKALAIIEHLIAMAEQSGLPQKEIDSLLGSLRRLRYNSISRSGGNLYRVS